MKFPMPKKIKDYLTRRRHRRFLSLYDLPERGTVLDISCGEGDFLEVLRSYFPALELHGVDISEQYISRAREKYPWATLHASDASAVPYGDRTFDAVLSCMSLHHYKSPTAIFMEISRVLRPGGRVYVLDFVPEHRIIQILFNLDGCPEPYHFEKYYLKKEILSLAACAGLQVEKIRKMGLFSRAKIILARKIS